MNVYIFKGKKPAPLYAFFMGAVMEVFHMYVVLLTHRDNMDMAYYVVKICSGPMIIFTGLGLALSSAALLVLSEGWKNPLEKVPQEDVHLSDRFQIRLFIGILIVFAVNFSFTYFIQTQTAEQNAHHYLNVKSDNIAKAYRKIINSDNDPGMIYYAAANEGTFDIIKPNGTIQEGNHKNFSLTGDLIDQIRKNTRFKEAELCHRIEMNHSARFWAEVERVMPDYREPRKWLRDHGSEIMARMTG